MIPYLQGEPDDVDLVSNDLNPDIHVKDSNIKLAKCRNYLIESYNNEFLSNLFSLATDVRDKHKQVPLHSIQVGDVELIN